MVLLAEDIYFDIRQLPGQFQIKASASASPATFALYDLSSGSFKNTKV